MRYFFLGIILVIIFLAAYQYFSKPKMNTITIGKNKITVEIAQTTAEKAQGLSGRENLPENSGLLFVYDKPGIHNFHMGGMKFPLDFVWIADGQVVEVTENVLPADFQPPKYLQPKNPADKVLEINAGTVKRLNIKIGDNVI